MIKIWKYELRRLLFNKFFFGLLLILLWTAWSTLTGQIILGVSNTAPFSAWSFGAFLSSMLPLLSIIQLLFISFFTSCTESYVQILTAATPVNRNHYILVRCAAVLTGCLLVVVCLFIMSMIFYAKFFHFYAFGTFAVPALLTLLPAALFIMGLGKCAGSIHPVLVYGLMVLVLLLSYVPLPNFMDLNGTAFFVNTPGRLKTLDTDFTVPAAVLIGKCAYSLIGLLLFFAPVRWHSKKLRFR